MIEVTSRWVIDCDGVHNFIPSVRKVVQDGKNKGSVYLTPMAYYSDLKGAVKYVAGQIVKEGIEETDWSLREACEYVNKVYSDFEDVLKGIKEVINEEGNVGSTDRNDNDNASPGDGAGSPEQL